MSFLKRLFSADYRRALSAEAAGDFVGAARAYALAGERAKVAEMMYERARRCPTPESRLIELRSAVTWADGNHAEARAARRRLARAFEEWAQLSGLVSEADRDVLREAATLYSSVGEHRQAAECFDKTGDALKAAKALEASGDLERLETLFFKEEQKRRREARQHEAIEDYRIEYRSGHRRRAREALARGLDAAASAPGDKAEGEPDRLGLRRFIKELDERRLGQSLRLTSDGNHPARLVVGERLVIGRDPACQLVLVDAGISRQHVRLEWTARDLTLRDLGARNGTRWRGLTIDKSVALAASDQGELELGPEGRLRVETTPTEVRLEIMSGLERGFAVRWSRVTLPLADGVALGIDDGGWLTFALDEDAGARLNDVPVAGTIEPLIGDILVVGAQRWDIAK